MVKDLCKGVVINALSIPVALVGLLVFAKLTNIAHVEIEKEKK